MKESVMNDKISEQLRPVCNEALLAMEKLEEQRRIKWKRQVVICSNICPDCGRALKVTKEEPSSWMFWLGGSELVTRTCPVHGVVYHKRVYVDGP